MIGPGKSDILAYYAAGYGPVSTMFVVQPTPAGLCDAIFRAAPFVADDEPVLVGLPDTVWYPENGFGLLPADRLAFLLFPVERPEFFDAVLLDAAGRVREIQVKRPDAASHWIWGAFRMPGRVLKDLAALWRARDGRDEFIGSLVNAYLAAGGDAVGVRAGSHYVDVGTFNGYRAAIDLLGQMAETQAAAQPSADGGGWAAAPRLMSGE